MSATPATAFELTSEHQLETYGGTTHLRDGLHINIGEALKEGEGVLVTDDPLVINILRGRWDLQETRVPEGSKITSHQLESTLAEQHEILHHKPEIADPNLSSISNARDLVAAQARGDLPVPTLPPPGAYDDVTDEQRAEAERLAEQGEDPAVATATDETEPAPQPTSTGPTDTPPAAAAPQPSQRSAAAKTPPPGQRSTTTGEPNPGSPTTTETKEGGR